MDRVEMTINDLKQILRETGGVDDAADLDGDILDVEFSDLGYDSVALLEASGRIELQYGIALPEETVASVPTPRGFLAVVNDSLAE